MRTAGAEFVWQLSEEGWAEVLDKLAAMDSGACHQYLDGPSDDLQVMASIGEYGDSWWRRQAADVPQGTDQDPPRPNSSQHLAWWPQLGAVQDAKHPDFTLGLEDFVDRNEWERRE